MGLFGLSALSRICFGDIFAFGLATPKLRPPPALTIEKQGTSMNASPTKIMFLKGILRASSGTYRFTSTGLPKVSEGVTFLLISNKYRVFSVKLTQRLMQ